MEVWLCSRPNVSYYYKIKVVFLKEFRNLVPLDHLRTALKFVELCLEQVEGKIVSLIEHILVILFDA